MHLIKFTTTIMLMAASISAVAIPQASTASNPRGIIDQWNASIKNVNDYLNNINTNDDSFIANTQTALKNVQEQAALTSGFNDKLLASIATTNLNKQPHNEVQSAFSGIQGKLNNILALNPKSANFDLQAQGFVSAMVHIWCRDYLFAVLKAWKIVGVDEIATGLNVCPFQAATGTFPGA
ncbi:hypothetical protein OCU04_004489 [Sclerotinia nivalis]|uniref:Uncharacterized protein n=1 Tax=Sclerotinia nivalis TaxID=352851 RepID=A0A9X0DL59_9HELO|nr:hypothetical protein OCU04_004489 [Sclerotinia nivalis]